MSLSWDMHRRRQGFQIKILQYFISLYEFQFLIFIGASDEELSSLIINIPAPLWASMSTLPFFLHHLAFWLLVGWDPSSYRSRLHPSFLPFPVLRVLTLLHHSWTKKTNDLYGLNLNNLSFYWLLLLIPYWLLLLIPPTSCFRAVVLASLLRLLVLLISWLMETIELTSFLLSPAFSRLFLSDICYFVAASLRLHYLTPSAASATNDNINAFRKWQNLRVITELDAFGWILFLSFLKFFLSVFLCLFKCIRLN